MKPFLTPHANVRPPQSAVRPPLTPATAMRSTVLLSLLLAPRHDQRANGSRTR
jgi:hypothetical protein